MKFVSFLVQRLRNVLVLCLMMGGGSANAQISSTDSETGLGAVSRTLSRPLSDAALWGQVLTQYHRAPPIARSSTHKIGSQTALFDYQSLGENIEDLAKLQTYIIYMTNLTPATMKRDAQMVYWANLYNAVTVYMVTTDGMKDSIKDGAQRPIKSIKPKPLVGYRQRGPWKTKLVVVEGRALSLDHIEHDILRENFKTPMVHYMLNCASLGCPDLKSTPWRAESLRVDQENAARAFINAPRGVYFDGHKMIVSKIYKWFKKDFGKTTKQIKNHLIRYSAPAQARRIEAHKKTLRYQYNWSLNKEISHDK